MPIWSPPATVFGPTTEGHIAAAIRAYLEQAEKQVNLKVLDEMVDRYRMTILRQLMEAKRDRKGKESSTLYTKACARQARYTYDGAVGEPITARSLLRFLLGDVVELTVLALAELAGVPIQDNNRPLKIAGQGDDTLVDVHPDGLYRHGDDFYNVEIKSCDSRTWDRWYEQGGPSDTWGYCTQASIQCAAWREAGIPVLATNFIAVSTGTRQGSMADWIVPYDGTLVEAWHARRALVLAAAMPDMAYHAEPEIEFKRGSKLNPEDTLHGDPVPRTNSAGKVYGHDVPTGRMLVPTPCTYCAYRALDFPTAVMEVDGGKPKWVVPA